MIYYYPILQGQTLPLLSNKYNKEERRERSTTTVIESHMF